MLDSRPLEDPGEIERRFQRAQSRSLRRVLLIIAALMMAMAAGDLVLSPVGDGRPHISLSVAAVALLFHQLLLWNPGRWKSPLLVMGVLAATTWSVYSYGSVRAASGFAFLAAVVMAGTYLRLRATWLTALAGVAALGALTWAEASGHMARPSMVPDLRYWMMASIIVLLIGSQLYDSRKATDEDYVRHLSQMEERLRLEHERDQSMRRFRRIFQLNPTPLLVQAANNQAVVEVNPAFERGFGLRGRQIVGMHAGEFWVDDQQWQTHRRTLFEKGRTDWQPCRWKRADGKAMDVLVSSELSEDPSGALILTTVIENEGAA